MRRVPSHAPPQVELSEVQAVRELRGAPVTAEQVPALPASLHASHWPEQAPSQQTPSAQKPELHSVFPPQAVPRDLAKVATSVWSTEIATMV